MYLKLFLCGIIFLITPGASAETQLASKASFYYGEDFKFDPQTSNLKTQLHNILNAYHISQNNDFDRIVAHCLINKNKRCYSHRQLSYKEARQYLFGSLHLETDSNEQYSITSVYCRQSINNDQMPQSKRIGPMLIPHAAVINAEHVWPQSHFSGKFSKGLQKSDLHSLYPVKMRVNSTRGNYPFGRIESFKNVVCDEAALGTNHKGRTVFEPSNQAKGNVARSLFYFSTRYKIVIDPIQESRLRQWHKMDPVDQEELDRNHEIFNIQHVRNPYIDHPEWVSDIKNF